MGVPDRLLPHTVTRVRPVTTTDAHGNATETGTSEKSMAAWVQQDQRTEPRTDGRDPLVQLWLMLTNDTDVLGGDRIEWGGKVFEVEGPPEPVYTPAGYHHTESTLRAVSG